MDQYASWSTGIAALPESQTYQAFLAIARNLGLDPTALYAVTSQYSAMVYNVRLPGYLVDQSNLEVCGVIPSTSFMVGTLHGTEAIFLTRPT